MTNMDSERIERRLDIIIALLLRIVETGGKKLSARDQIGILNELGLRPTEIANILGRKASYISKELVGLRKGKGR